MALNFRSTVIIPVFNSGEVLKDAVESVLSQSNGKDEIVIVDDGSTDADTLKVIDVYIGHPNIKVVRHEHNKCLGAARNTGVRNASADIIVLLDADDKLAQGYFEKMLKPFSDPDIAFTYCDVQCFGESDELWTSAPFDPAKVVENQLIGGCSPFRKSVHEAVGGYCEKPRNEDWDFWLSVCERGFKGVYIPGGMYLYRRHENTLSIAPRTFAVTVQQRMLDRHRDFILKYMSPQQFLAWAYHQAGYAHLKTNEPLVSVKYAIKLLTISGRRLQGVRLLLATARHIVSLNK